MNSRLGSIVDGDVADSYHTFDAINGISFDIFSANVLCEVFIL